MKWETLPLLPPACSHTFRAVQQLHQALCQCWDPQRENQNSCLPGVTGQCDKRPSDSHRDACKMPRQNCVPSLGGEGKMSGPQVLTPAAHWVHLWRFKNYPPHPPTPAPPFWCLAGLQWDLAIGVLVFVLFFVYLF